MKRNAQPALLRPNQAIALMTETQSKYYKSHRTKAIVFGLIQLWTFPLFSWPTMIPIAAALHGNDPWALKIASMQIVFLSPLILPPIAIGFARASKRYRTLARNIRIAVTEANKPDGEQSA